jgi:hypothetical protein
MTLLKYTFKNIEKIEEEKRHMEHLRGFVKRDLE